MRIAASFALALALAGPAAAQTLPADQPSLHALAGDVQANRLHATIERLVAFGTRHTLSDTRSNVRGIGAARRWVEREFRAMSAACRGCLEIATPSETVTGNRINKPTQVVDVLAIQRGASDPGRVVIISGHLDSRVTDVMDATSNAPGADDDGSGVAAVMEAARVLSRHRYPATIVYAVTSGEEQGLYGGAILARYAQAQSWRVEAALNNDIIGGAHSQSGAADATHVRVFSEGTRATETKDEADRRRATGGEVDSPSRNLARFIDVIADRYLTGFDAVMVYRTDRFSRGGDQIPMLEAGYPAVRFTEAQENYAHEHQNVRTENGVHFGDTIDGIDAAYLAQVARLNIVSLAALAAAPAPPAGVGVSGAVSADTTLKWAPTPGAARYRVWWRATTDPQWRFNRLAADGTQLTLPGVNIDDWYFGVSSISADGFESPVVFPGAAGAFAAPPQSAAPKSAAH